MIYSQNIIGAYESYKELLPLDLQNDGNQEAIATWRKVIRYSLSEYSRKVALLAQSATLDDFVRRSGADFDNLANVIETALKAKFVSISSNGEINSLISPHQLESGDSNIETLEPNALYNQFPCDVESSRFRAEFIISRYPYSDQLHVGLIGDDDFISLQLMNNEAVQLSIVEKDERIIETIESQKKPHNSVKIYNIDARESLPQIGVDTFVTDPPYTFDGALSFIVCGLSMMTEYSGKEFYVILNPTMMGDRLMRLIAALAEQNIQLTFTQNNVSNYQLPDNFGERDRANRFLTSMDIESRALSYSSNSTMYIFSITETVNVNLLRRQINEDNMYEHYL